jgi:hypothetical protein
MKKTPGNGSFFVSGLNDIVGLNGYWVNFINIDYYLAWFAL